MAFENKEISLKGLRVTVSEIRIHLALFFRHPICLSMRNESEIGIVAQREEKRERERKRKREIKK